MLRKAGKEMFQGVRIAGLLEDVSGNFIEETVAATEPQVEEKQETIVTEQESLTIIESLPKPKKAKKV
jgi:hypothetical protein